MADFDAVAQKLREAQPSLSDEQKKEVYGLFKQATCGDINVEKPGLMSGFEARGKWDAWDAKKGMSQDDAKQAYVDFVTPLLG